MTNRFFRGLGVALPVLLLVHGCSLAPDDEADGARSEPTSISPVGDIEVPARPPPQDSAAESPATPAPDVLTENASEPQETPAADESTSTDSIASRLARIDSVQRAILRRFDSLDAAGATGSAPDRAGNAESAQSADSTSGSVARDVLGGARDEVRSFGVGVIWSILVVVLFNFVIGALVWIIETLAERSVSRRLFYKRLVPITRMVLWAFAVYLIVRVIFRVDAQGIIAAGAALGVALGFAAQDLLKNVFGGLIVVFDQPFQVGDKISVGGTYGEVVSIGLRSTRLVTPDDSLVTVPNSQVVLGQVSNANAGELNCQVVTDLYLPGRVDERLAKDIAFDAAVNSSYVFLAKPIVVLVEDEFRTTFVSHIKVKAYVLDTRFEFLMRSDITERAREGFRAAGLLPEHSSYALVDVQMPSPPRGADAP